MRTIAVVALKGSQTKTTSVVNIAACLAGQGSKARAMLSSVFPIADGAAGVGAIVQTLAPVKTAYGRLPAMRAAAIRIIGNVGDHDQAAQIVALARYVREHVRYLNHPHNAQYVQTPDVMLIQIDRAGFVYGDCTMHALLFASLCEAIGIPCDIAGVTAPGSLTPDHVIVVAHLDAGDLEYDLTCKGFEQPAYGEKILP